MSVNAFHPIFSLFQSDSGRVWLSSGSINLTGAQCLAEVQKKQAALSSCDFFTGCKVLVFTGRELDYWIDVLAIWGLGGIAIPVDHQVDQSTLDYMIEKSSPDLSVGCPKDLNIDLIQHIEPQSEANSPQIATCVNVTETQVASILFTSGTTGSPKGVVLNHSSIHGNALATVSSFEMKGIRKLFAPIPFRFVSALSHFVATLYNGVSYSGCEKKYLKTELLSELSSNGCDAFGGSPLQLRWISELAADYSLKLNWLMASGDNLPIQTITALKEVMPNARVVTAYGLTELAGRFCILPPSMTDEKAGSVGKPITGLSYAILDDEYKPVPLGESGQIFVSGRYLFSGYLNDQEKTDLAFTKYGFGTGDMGTVDSDGYLYLSGRSDDVFKSAGLKVSTLPIAALLMTSGQFDDLAVVSKEDETLGHVPVVYYVLKPGSEFRKGPLMKAIRAQLPPGHLPREFHKISKIPRTGSGKVQRKALKELITTQLA